MHVKYRRMPKTKQLSRQSAGNASGGAKARGTRQPASKDPAITNATPKEQTARKSMHGIRHVVNQIKMSNTKRQPKTGAVKRPHRYKPGTVALRDCPRTQAPETLADKKDAEFKVSWSTRVALLGTLTPAMQTRLATRVFFNVADNLPVLASQHVPDDEAIQYRKFLGGVQGLLQAKPLGNNLSNYFESEHGVW